MPPTHLEVLAVGAPHQQVGQPSPAVPQVPRKAPENTAQERSSKARDQALKEKVCCLVAVGFNFLQNHFSALTRILEGPAQLFV